MSFSSNDHKLRHCVPFIAEHHLTIGGAVSATFNTATTNGNSQAISIGNARRLGLAYTMSDVTASTGVVVFNLQVASSDTGATWHTIIGEGSNSDKGSFSITVTDASQFRWMDVAGRFVRLRVTTALGATETFTLSDVKLYTQS